jgi:hypothetical protein
MHITYLKSRKCDLVIRFPGCRARGPESDSRRYHTFLEVVCLERSPLSLLSITEELLEWKSICSGSRKPRLKAMRIRCAEHILHPQKLALTSPTSGGRLVGIVRLRSKDTEFSFLITEYFWFLSPVIRFEHLMGRSHAFTETCLNLLGILASSETNILLMFQIITL